MTVAQSLHSSYRWLALLMASALAAAIAASLVFWYVQFERNQLAIDFIPDKLQWVQGKGSIETTGITIQRLSEQGLALLSSPQSVRFSTQSLHQLSYCIETDTADLRLRLLWTLQHTGNQIHSIDLTTNAGCHQLLPNWRGLVTGIGLQLEGDLQQPFVLTEFTVRPSPLTSSQLAQQLWQDWTQYQGWHASSVNFIRLGSMQPLVALPLLLAVWVVLSSVLFKFLYWSGQLGWAVWVSVLIAWLLLDGLWLRELGQRTWATHQQMADKTLSKRLEVYDGDLIDTLEKLRSELPSTPQRVFILADSEHRTQKARLHYHLLPHNIYSYEKNPLAAARPGDYLIIMGRLENIRYRNRKGREALFWGANNQHQLAVKPLYGDANAALFAVRTQL